MNTENLRYLLRKSIEMDKRAMSQRWDGYFLDLALRTAQMSKDPSTKVGAVIVGPLRDIRTTGYNGFPRGMSDHQGRYLDRALKYELIVHAEENCVAHAARRGFKIDGCSLYLVASTADGDSMWGGPPCARCMATLVQAGIKEIVTYPWSQIPARWSASVALSHMIIGETGIKYREVQIGK